MQKKLKGWQIALLIIFYPIGILYLIVKLASKSTTSQSTFSTDEKKTSSLMVYTAEGGKVYHLVENCSRSKNIKQITEDEAIKQGLTECKVCCTEYQRELASNDKILDIISCSLVACVYPNPDGTSRQTYLVNSKVGEDVIFKPAPTKEYPDTIGVFTKKGCIGVLPYKVLNELRGLYAHNNASAIIKSIEKSERGLGCTIKIIIYK